MFEKVFSICYFNVIPFNKISTRKKFKINEAITPEMDVLNGVAVIKIIPDTIRGKYKIGQTMKKDEKIALGKNIIERNTKPAKHTLEIMGFSVSKSGVELENDVEW